jgi:(2Fe-2S) ferredoxin
MFKKPEKQILVCNSFRVGGEAKGVCNKKGVSDLIQYLEEEILDRGIDALVSTTGCLKACDHGPILVVQPDNIWYEKVDNEATIDAILDALEDGEVAEAHAL